MTPIIQRGDGAGIQPGEGVVPVLHEVSPGVLRVVGTGFYLTRYGLVATAKHVIEDLVDVTGTQLGVAFVAHLYEQDQVILRRIRKAHLLKSADVAVVQADNYLEKYPTAPLMNLRARVSERLPEPGAPLVTYAYPENMEMDFRDPSTIPVIRGDYFEGGFLRFVAAPEHPFMQFPYFETTVEVRSGASGGPVFDNAGSVIGLNCRGWDFKGAEHEGGNLSYIVPVTELLNVEVETSMVPAASWEMAQIPLEKRGQPLTLRELARLGHLEVDGA